MRQHCWLRAIVVVVLSIGVLGSDSLVAQSQGVASSTLPRLVLYSGVAKDNSGKPLTGTVGVTFALYSAEQGGAPLWVETQNVQADARGRFTVSLGATKPDGLPQDLFVSGEARWIGVQPAGQAEQPRAQLISVPYAMKAGDAETIGGLPPSAFVLAAPAAAASSATTVVGTAPPPPASGVTTAGGAVNTIPLWSTATDIENSVLTQTGTGTTAKIGVNTTTPATTLDVKGATTLRGNVALPAIGAATSTAGKNSQPQTFTASSFNSGTVTAVNQSFRWQAEAVGNNTANASGTLNLLFGQGTSAPTETGLKVARNGQITFATGQTFPGTGNGTITGVTAGTGLTGGGTSGGVTLNIDATKVVTGITAGTDLTGGGSGGVLTLNLDTTKVPQLNGANTFVGNQAFVGNVSSNGTINGITVDSSLGFSIRGNLFDYGSLNTANEFFGFAGNTTMTGGDNVATGQASFVTNTTGNSNTADGIGSLKLNDAGSNNSAVGFFALFANAGGNSNTAVGANALITNTTGSNNTALGANAGPDSGHPGLTNATAIGANAEVTASNAMVLGSINGVNGATADTSVGIGTTAPTAKLDVHGTGNFTGLITFAPGQTFPGTGTITAVNPGTGLTGGGTSGGVTLAVDPTKVVTSVTAGNGLTGGGAGGVSLSVDATKVPLLAASNTFTGSQVVNGNLSATGAVTGNSFQIGSNLFAFGSYANFNAFLGFGGNMNNTTTGQYNTGVGFQAVPSDIVGCCNTGVGYSALEETNASGNTGVGFLALSYNGSSCCNTAIGSLALNFETGTGNTAVGYNAGNPALYNLANPGDNDTYLGYGAGSGNSVAISNATAIGAFASVEANNSVVLGSISGWNGATVDANVGIGTTAPTFMLHLGNKSGVSYTGKGYLRIEGPPNTGSGKPSFSMGGNGEFQIDANGINSGRFVVKENGFVGILSPSPIGPLAVGQGKGAAFADAWLTYSSRRWKDNIQPLDGALGKVEQLRGVSYDLKANGKREIGLIAEEVGEVVPEVVSYEENGKDAQGVDYSRLTALLIEAVKQQQKEIQAQQERISRLTSKVNRLESTLRETKSTDSARRVVRQRTSVKSE